MKAAKFDHYEPTTVDEAVSLLDDLEDPTLLAGGQSQVPMMRFRLSVPDAVIDLNSIDNLNYIREEDDRLKIGALTRHVDVEESHLINTKYGSFADTAPLIGDPQVRNRGTVVGSIAQADPKGDWGSILLAHEGEIVAQGLNGDRTIPADEFFLLPYDNALDDDELITEIRVPISSDNEGSAYHKLKRKVGDFAMTGAAARVVIEGQTIRDATIALTAVDITNIAVQEAADHLVGEQPTPGLLKEAAEIAADNANPESDEHGSKEYKQNMTRVLTQRALVDAIERARTGNLVRNFETNQLTVEGD